MFSMICAPVGQMCRVERLAGCGCFQRRMQEMGIVPGAGVAVLRRGDPMLVRVGETRLMLGGDIGERVFVRPLAATESVMVRELAGG